MDAFEQLVSEILTAEGYWVQTSVKVKLTREEKISCGRPSSPRWELDVVAYKAASNELLVVECKSFLDSTGVQLAELQDGHSSTRYKLFREPVLREVVLSRLATQCVEEGRCRPAPVVHLAMVAGKVRKGDDTAIAAHFADRGWSFFGPEWLRQHLSAAAADSYDNKVSSIVAKLLLRPSSPAAEPSSPRPKLDRSQRICLLVNGNPKVKGSQAHARFQGYFDERATTIEGALNCGLRMDDIRNDLAKGYIAIVPDGPSHDQNVRQ